MTTNRRRAIVVWMDVGEASERECGDCDFRSFDFKMGAPDGTEICSCPSWDMPDVTGGVRHERCLAAETHGSFEEAAKIVESRDWGDPIVSDDIVHYLRSLKRKP